MSTAALEPAIGLPNVQEWIIIAVVAVLLFGRRLPEVIAQVLHGIRVARQHLDELRRSSGFDEDLREAQRAITQTRETIKREARELTAPIPTIQGAKDAVRREITGIGSDIEDEIRRTPPPEGSVAGEGEEHDPMPVDTASPDTMSVHGGETNPETGGATPAEVGPDADEPGATIEERGPDPEPRDPGR